MMSQSFLGIVIIFFVTKCTQYHLNPSVRSARNLKDDSLINSDQPKVELDMNLSLNVKGLNTWSIHKTIASVPGEKLLQALMSVLTQEQQGGIEDDIRSGVSFLSNSISDGTVNIFQTETSQSSNDVQIIVRPRKI